jgi:acyl-CoA thioesterase-2
MTKHENLKTLLDLEAIEVNLFRGFTQDQTQKRIFGGQVIAQALMAAYRTVEDRICHSLHCYFIRPGDPKVPILFEVERARDGKSFATRRVAAIQHGEQIFNLAASFQTPEDGFEHQSPMPSAPEPLSVTDDFEERKRLAANLPPRAAQAILRPMAIEMRSVAPQSFTRPKPMQGDQQVWMRSADPVNDDVAFNQAVLAYASDMSLLGTSMRPHGIVWTTPGFQSASLDHAIWFHRHSRFDAWHLYAQDSPSAQGARGFIRGEIYGQDGTLVASVAQEGLIRYRAPEM